MPKISVNLTVLLLLLPGILSASLIEELRSKIHSSAPFTAEFKQEMSGDDQAELEESGFFLYASSNRMKWEYREPEVKIFILYDDRVSFYNPLENQLTIGDVKNQKNQWLWQILLQDQTDVIISEDRVQNSISFRQQSEEMQLTVFLGKNGLPERAVQVDSLGYRHQYFFSRYRVHCRIDQSDFVLKLPEGVDIIEME